MKIRLTIAAAAIALAALSASAASAAINFTAVSYTLASSLTAGQTLVTDFNTGISPSTLGIAPGYSFSWCSYGCSHTYTGLNTGQTGLYSNVDLISGISARPPGSVPSNYAGPNGSVSPGQYTAIVGGTDGGKATLEAPGHLSTLSLLWGSVDDYNLISFYSGSTLVKSFSGSDITSPTPANGDQTSPLTNLEVKFFIPEAYDVDKVVFSATGNSFEFDNITATVPEPGTWMMLIVGFGLIGLMMRRREFVSALTA